MFHIKKCAVITWDIKNYFYGIKYRYSKNTGKIIETCSSSEINLSFAEQIRSIYKQLKCSTEEKIIIGGYFSSSLTFSLDIHSLSINDINRYLQYELPRHLPYGIDELQWCFKPTKFTENNKKVKRIKIFVIKKDEWNKFLANIAESGIRIDAIIPPFMAIDPLYSDIDICMAGIDQTFFHHKSERLEHAYNFSKNDESKNDFNKFYDLLKAKYQNLSKVNYNDYIPAVILAEYVLSEQCNKNNINGFELTKNLTPRRSKNLKIINLFLAIFLILLALSYFGRITIYNNDIMQKLLNKKYEIKSSVNKINRKLNIAKEKNRVINEIIKLPPESSINLLKYLDFFSKNLPDNIWISNINSYNNKINIVFKAKGSTNHLMSAFYDSTLFTIVDTRKSVMGDETTIYMTLKNSKNDPVR
jgi:hypothetical protein